MDQFKLRQLMVRLPGITECINKANKLPQTQLPLFSLGQEDFFIEQNLIKTKS